MKKDSYVVFTAESGVELTLQSRLFEDYSCALPGKTRYTERTLVSVGLPLFENEEFNATDLETRQHRVFQDLDLLFADNHELIPSSIGDNRTDRRVSQMYETHPDYRAETVVENVIETLLNAPFDPPLLTAREAAEAVRTFGLDTPSPDLPKEVIVDSEQGIRLETESLLQIKRGFNPATRTHYLEFAICRDDLWLLQETLNQLAGLKRGPCIHLSDHIDLPRYTVRTSHDVKAVIADSLDALERAGMIPPEDAWRLAQVFDAPCLSRQINVPAAYWVRTAQPH